MNIYKSRVWVDLLFQFQEVFFKKLKKEGSWVKSEYHWSYYIYVKFYNKNKGF